MIEICDLKEIGTRLKKAREKQSREAKEIAAEVGVDDSLYGRWEKGRIPNGARKVTLAGAVVGLQPNELFLADATIPQTLPIVLEDVTKTLVQMDALCSDAQKKPSQIFAEHLRELLSVMRDVPEASKIPKDTKIRIEGPGLLTLEPARKRQAGSASEDPAPYGTRKGKRSKK